MAQVINTNISSLNAQRNLNSSQSSLATSLQRLSTGLRINSAKDDAAGLAISERFTTQIRGLNQAVRNANDGISFAQTAEGALGTVGDALQRIRELSVQAINDTNSPSDRAALNNEVGQLIAEVNRISNTTQFNGQNILDGSLSTLTFQVGANQNQTILVDGVDSRGSQLGAFTSTGSSTDSATLIAATDDLVINGTAVDASAAKASGSVSDLITAINAVANDSGVEAQKASTNEVTLAFLTTNSDTVTVNGVDVAFTATDAITVLVDDINAVTGQTGVTAAVSGSDIVFTSENAADFTLETTNATTLGGAVLDTNYQAGVVLSTEVGGPIGLAATALADFGLSATVDSTDILTDVNVLTGTAANDALLTLDFALNQVNGLRATLGATQTRFESTISSLSITSENLSAARSRILDADFAAETSNLTRAQILQQAGTAMLAQANAIPQNVLSLLG